MSVVDGMCRQSLRGKVACKGCAVECVCSAGSGLSGQVMRGKYVMFVLARLGYEHVKLIHLKFRFSILTICM